jgi:hypothetical protein
MTLVIADTSQEDFRIRLCKDTSGRLEVVCEKKYGRDLWRYQWSAPLSDEHMTTLRGMFVP